MIGINTFFEWGFFLLHFFFYFGPTVCVWVCVSAMDMFPLFFLLFRFFVFCSFHWTLWAVVAAVTYNECFCDCALLLRAVLTCCCLIIEAWSALNRAGDTLIFIWICSLSLSLYFPLSFFPFPPMLAVMVFVVWVWTLLAVVVLSATLFIITSLCVANLGSDGRRRCRVVCVMLWELFLLLQLQSLW